MYNNPNSFPELRLKPLITAAIRWAKQHPSIISISLHHPLDYETSEDKYIIVFDVPDPFAKEFYSLEFALRATSREYKDSKNPGPFESQNFFMNNFIRVYKDKKAPYDFRSEWQIELKDYRERVLDGVQEEGCWFLYFNKYSDKWSEVRKLKIETIIREVKDDIKDLFQCIKNKLKLQHNRNNSPLKNIYIGNKDVVWQIAKDLFDKKKASNPDIYPHIKKEYLAFLETTSLKERHEPEQFLEKILCQIIEDSGFSDIKQKECSEILKKIKSEEKEHSTIKNHNNVLSISIQSQKEYCYYRIHTLAHFFPFPPLGEVDPETYLPKIIDTLHLPRHGYNQIPIK